jgi:hypothetical protein
MARHQANFLGDNLVTGKKTLDFAENKRLRLVVHFSNEVNNIFIVHLMFVLVSVVQIFTSLASQPFKV